MATGRLVIFIFFKVAYPLHLGAFQWTQDMDIYTEPESHFHCTLKNIFCKWIHWEGLVRFQFLLHFHLYLMVTFSHLKKQKAKFSSITAFYTSQRCKKTIGLKVQKRESIPNTSLGRDNAVLQSKGVEDQRTLMDH